MKHLIPKLAALLVSSVFTLAHANPAAGAPHPGHHAGPHGGSLISQLGRLKSQLNLTDAQQAIWQDAETASKAAHTAAQQAHSALRAQIGQEIQKDVIDFRAIEQSAEAAHASAKAARDTARDKWYVAYDSLSPEQKAQVSKIFQQKWAKMAAMREQWQQKHPAGVKPG